MTYIFSSLFSPISTSSLYREGCTSQSKDRNWKNCSFLGTYQQWIIVFFFDFEYNVQLFYLQLPAIEVVSKLPPVDRDLKRPPISVVVVCPTRELADQAAAEANKLLKFHPSIGVQLVIGGTRMALEQKRMHTNPCQVIQIILFNNSANSVVICSMFWPKSWIVELQILVATPGRLRDHMENTPGFATRLLGVKVLILDEADRLLDMGFRSDIEKIVAALPKQHQTLLFSATVPDEVSLWYTCCNSLRCLVSMPLVSTLHARFVKYVILPWKEILNLSTLFKKEVRKHTLRYLLDQIYFDCILFSKSKVVLMITLFRWSKCI